MFLLGNLHQELNVLNFLDRYKSNFRCLYKMVINHILEEDDREFERPQAKFGFTKYLFCFLTTLLDTHYILEFCRKNRNWEIE